MTLTAYGSRKEERRGHTNTEDGVDASIQKIEDYIQKREERLITTIRNNIDNMKTNRKTINRKLKWEKKQLHGHFK